MENMIPTVAAAAVGMAIGGAAYMPPHRTTARSDAPCTDFPAGQKKL